MKNIQTIALVMLFLCITITSYAQQTLTGYIVDDQSGELIPFATVFNLNTKQGTYTDVKGYFELPTTFGKDSVQIKVLGYQDKKVRAEEELSSISMTASSLQLEEVVISANREQEKRTEVPVAISSINQQTIKDNKATTIDQLLNQVPGVNMVDLGNEQHTMSIRRPIDYGASYLYLEDGIPIRTSGVFNHNALLEINMANTSRIELIRGPASSMYGSEAIGGAVNFISKRPSLLPSAGISIQGNDIGYRRTDFNASTTINEKLGVRLSGYYANQENSTLEHSDFDKLALSWAAHYYSNEKTEFVWSSTLVDYYSDMSGSLDSADFYSKSYGSNQTFTNREVNAFRTKLAMNHYWNQHAKTSITAFFRQNSIRQNPSYRVRDDFKPWIPSGNPNLARGEENDNSFSSYGIVVQQKQSFNWINASLVGGVSLDYSPNTYEANYIEIFKSDAGIYESFTSFEDSLLADYEVDLVNVAAYLQAKFELLPSLNLIAAVRYDNFNYDFDNKLDSNAFTGVLDGKDVFNRFTPKVGFTYDAKENRGFYGNYSQGYVPPQVSELYRGNKAPTLDPVYYHNYEIGAWLTLLNGKLKLDLGLYKMDGRNEIISVLQDDGSTIRQNAGETIHEGIEYGVSAYLHKDLSLRISGTNAKHEFDDYEESGTDFSGKDLPQAPEWIMNTQLTYKPKYIKGFRISIEWQHIDEYFMDQSNTKKYEGYDVFNLRLAYERKAFELWTNIMNIGDELYATVARSNQWGQTYSLGNPRNITVGLAYKFQKKQ